LLSFSIFSPSFFPFFPPLLSYAFGWYL
jgi:hypothetical protein